jgi:hypothetical protein
MIWSTSKWSSVFPDREEAWSKEVGERLGREFALMLKEDEFVPKMSKLGFIHFLVQACPHQKVSPFISWLEGLSGGTFMKF